jgi:hypothetical protein
MTKQNTRIDGEKNLASDAVVVVVVGKKEKEKEKKATAQEIKRKGREPDLTVGLPFGA